ncbi:MAG: RDD family protein [Kiritimatiellaeota bacterium]|nr:RDD family protein [Kiritimatiellota bacterium]
MKTTALQIQTPEGATFTLHVASPLLRGVAVLIDQCVMMALARVLQAFMMMLNLVSPDIATALYVLLYFLLSLLYAIILEWFWHGQTLGKRLLRLRVMDACGRQLAFSQIAVRNLLRVLDSLPVFYLLGGAVAFFSARGQRLGDTVADTVVVTLQQPKAPNIRPLIAGRWNSLRAHPVLEARLRQGISPAEATLLVQALSRRDDLDPAARLALYREIAADIQSRVTFPPTLLEDLTDEQFLRDTLDSLFAFHGRHGITEERTRAPSPRT